VTKLKCIIGLTIDDQDQKLSLQFSLSTTKISWI